MDHKEWLKKSVGDSQRSVACALGMDSGQLSRELNKGLDADRVIEIAYAYNLDAVKALQDTGHLRVETKPETVDGLLDQVLAIAEQAKQRLDSNSPTPHVRPPRQADYDLVADTSPDEDALEERDKGDWTDPENIP